MNLLRKTIFLITGTVTGVVGVLAYNPPHLSNAMASGNSMPTGAASNSTSNSTNGATNSSINGTNSNQSSTQTTQQTPAQPQSKQTTPAKKATSSQTNSSSNTTSTQSQTSSESTNTQSSPTPAAVQASGKSGTFKGEIAQTHYGPVQVQITVANGKITDVQALSYPDGDGRSQYISSVMIPWLTQETIKVQSTNIMNVSGATITGNAWKRSLASALQQAGL